LGRWRPGLRLHPRPRSVPWRRTRRWGRCRPSGRSHRLPRSGQYHPGYPGYPEHQSGHASPRAPSGQSHRRRRWTAGGQRVAVTRPRLLGRGRLWRAGTGEEARRRPQACGVGRGNPVNPRIGCGMQQAHDTTGGGSRRGREERRGRNEHDVGNVVPMRGRPRGSGLREWPMEGRSLRTLWKALGSFEPGGCERRLRLADDADTRRAVRDSSHAARSRGTTRRTSSANARRLGSDTSPGKPNDPVPRTVR